MVHYEAKIHGNREDEKSYISQEWERILLSKLQQLESSFPNCSQFLSAVKTQCFHVDVHLSGYFEHTPISVSLRW